VRGEVSRRLGLVLALVLALLAAPARAQPCPDCLQAGAARAPLRAPAGTPLAGYGAIARRLLLPDVLDRHAHAFWFRPSTGERDPLAVRALVLERAGRRVAWVAIDLLAVDGAFTADLERRLAAAGVAPALLVVSASHTHSGPGAYVDSLVLGWLALDRLDGAVRAALLDAAVAAVREADAARRPARLGAAERAVPDLVRSRLDQPLDPGLVVLRVTGLRDEPIALVWNYAIHGTMLGARNQRLSGDVMGEASRRLEQALGVPALFVNGAVGDVSPAGHGERALSDLGAALAAAARAAWSEAVPVAQPALRLGTRAVALPAPWLSARNCLRGWSPAALSLPLASVFPRETLLSAVAVGDAGWVTIPGELQTSLGGVIKRAGGAHLRYPLVAGLSNDYLGYFVTAADYARPSYVSCASLYGPEAGSCLADAAAGLLAAVARGERPPAARVACDR
jgi:hypothetical protein